MLNACIYNLRACISEGGDLLFIEIFTCSFDVTGFKDRFDGAQLLGAAQGNDGIELLGVDALSFDILHASTRERMLIARDGSPPPCDPLFTLLGLWVFIGFYMFL